MALKFTKTNPPIPYRDSSPSSLVGSDSAACDAFGRLRTSDPYTLFDSKQLFDNLPLFWNDIAFSGSGTASDYHALRASSIIGVSNTTAGVRVRQTKRRFNYQPGKSLAIVITFVLGTKQNGITRRVGYFDENNGIFLEISNDQVYIVRRSQSTGTVVDTKVNQRNWDDPLDGNGDSGITIDFEKVQILFIDLEWLGVGRVRCGVVVDGVMSYFHSFKAANVLTSVYMSTPNLPIRYELTNNGS